MNSVQTINNRRFQRFQAGRLDGQPYDNALVFCVVALLSLGIVMVYSATIASDSKTLEASHRHLIRHLFHIGIGSALLFATTFLNMQTLQDKSRVLLFLGLLSLIAVLVPGVGVEVNGSLRWISLGGIRVQPSEFMKIITVIYFADYLSRKKDNLHLFKVGIFNAGLVVGVIGFLLICEPDFGSVAVLVATVAIMMFLAGVRFWHFMVSVVCASALMAVVVRMESYRVVRLLSYQDPWADPFGSGFQLVQALIAIGRGNWLGTGLGSSIQKLFYLPHAGNDFLIAIIGEELGAVGIFCVLGLFVALLYRAFAIANRAFKLGHRFSGFLAQGLGVLLAVQASVHVGVNTGLLPTKGLTLPMMSYGGSSMVSSMIAIGLLFAINQQARPRVGSRT